MMAHNEALRQAGALLDNELQNRIAKATEGKIDAAEYNRQADIWEAADKQYAALWRDYTKSRVSRFMHSSQAKQLDDQLKEVKLRRHLAQAKMMQMDEVMSEARRTEAIKLLQEVRGDKFGGEGLVYQGRTRYTEEHSTPPAAGVTAMKFAESNYPQEWLALARQHSGPDGYSLVYGVPRGDYTDAARRIRISADKEVQVLGQPPGGRVATHEMGHVMEQAVPGLLQMEQAEMWRRTSHGDVGSRTIDAPEAMGGGYTGEYARADEFPDPYSGKDYAPRGVKVADSYELFSTGVESMFAGSMYTDEAFRQWMLGAMAVLGRDVPAAAPAKPEADQLAESLDSHAKLAAAVRARGGTAAQFLLARAAEQVRYGQYTAAAADIREAAKLPSGSSKSWGKTWNDLADRVAALGSGAPSAAAVTDTLGKYTRPDGTLDPAREQLHQQIIDKMLAGHHAKTRPVVAFFGGGPASGKSALTDAPDSVHVDPDQVKAQLPEYEDMLKAGDSRAAAYVHEESSLIARKAMQQAFDQHLNVTVDGTGDSSYAKMEAKVQAAREAGYTVHGKYVTADTETALERARLRGEATGRVVPETYLRETHRSVSQVFDQASRSNLFDALELHDNNGTKPRLIAKRPEGGRFTVRDKGAYQRFLDKAAPYTGSTEAQARAAEKGNNS